MTRAVAAYLTRLGLDEQPPATVETLFEIHQRHAERIPYENLHTMLGSPPPVDAETTLARVAAGGDAGYCFHHNGVMTVVLRTLGYDVVPVWGHNWKTEAEREDVRIGHLGLYVRGLPTESNPGGVWWPDVGCGDALHTPLPMVTGTYQQGPFVYRLELRDGGWTFHHDVAGSFGAVDLFDQELTPEQEAAAHRRLTAPDGGTYSRLLVVQRRLPEAIETVRGCLYSRITSQTDYAELTAYDDWRDALGTLGIALQRIDDDALRALFDRCLTAHKRWMTGL